MGSQYTTIITIRHNLMVRLFIFFQSLWKQAYILTYTWLDQMIMTVVMLLLRVSDYSFKI